MERDDVANIKSELGIVGDIFFFLLLGEHWCCFTMRNYWPGTQYGLTAEEVWKTRAICRFDSTAMNIKSEGKLKAEKPPITNGKRTEKRKQSNLR